MRAMTARGVAVLAVVAVVVAVEDKRSDISSAKCSGATAIHPLYGLPGQPESSSQSSTKCHIDATCLGNRIIKAGLFSTNDGPAPYDLELPENSPQPLSSSAMGQVYNDVGFRGVRNDESGMAFDVRCMFPDPNKDPDADENWNWTASDAIFNATVQAGLAPLLKIPVFEWNSPRVTGLSYVNSMGQPQYVINATNFGDCPAWPAYAPFMMKIGSRMALKIVDRYNANGLLNASAWAVGLAGVELMNEWAELRCGPSNNMSGLVYNSTSAASEWATFQENCFGEPWTWRAHYWDGTPQQAWQFYIEGANAIKERHPGVLIGGPATSVGQQFFLQQRYDGLGKWWIDGFLQAVKASGAPLDFFSWHYYGNGNGQPEVWDGNVFKQKTQRSYESLNTWYTGFRASLEEAGFHNTSMALTEYNAHFVLGNTSSYVGSLAGAAVNLGKLATMMNWPEMEAAFVLGGRVGAYTPMNPYTFPLDCAANDVVISMGRCSPNVSAEMAGKEDCRPESVTISGNTWSDCPTSDMSSLEGVEKCDEGKCQFSSAGGMGAIYVDGNYTPYAVALRMLKNAQGCRRLDISEEVAVRLVAANVSAVAWQPSSDNRFASVLLTNVDHYNTTKLPLVSNWFSHASVSGVVGASLLGQREVGQPHCGEIDGLQGLSSEVQLEGCILDASQAFCGDGNTELPALKPFQTVLLAVAYTGGCPCRPRAHGALRR